MMSEKLDQPAPPTTEDMLGYVALRRIADEVGGTLSIEYWKSAPYFLNFMDGYQLAEKFRDHELDPWSRRSLLEDAQVITSPRSAPNERDRARQRAAPATRHRND